MPPGTPLEPVDALRRIAFLMERSRAESRRVEAYRKAAATLLRIGPDEVAARVKAGTITDLPGIGASTGKAIVAAANGRVPERLAELEAAAGPLVTGGEELLALARGDLHTHSTWSDGGSPVEEMVATAMELGREYLALTDHSPRLTVANGLTAQRLTQQLDVVAAVNGAVGDDFRLLAGIEVDILDDGSLDQSEELLGRLDVVVASVHSKLRMPKAPMTRRMIAAVRHPRTTVLGHCTGRRVEGGRPRPPSEFDAPAVFAACGQAGVAVEINSRPERCDPPDELVTLALEAGCLFAVDTDAHAPGQLDFLAYGYERAARLGVPAERIITTWELPDLLEHARRPTGQRG